MKRPEHDTFEKLGSAGLTRVLNDVLDQTRLARLATACGLAYPGIRTRSQKRQRIVTDLVDRAKREDSARKAIYRVLTKETAAAARSWARLDAQERSRRLRDPDYLLSDGNFGRCLFLLASRRPADADDSELGALLERRDLDPTASSPPPTRLKELESARKDTIRLKKQVTELRKKINHLEGQVAKAKEAERTLKKDLLQRKGELAESRMLAEKLRRDLDTTVQSQTVDPVATERLTRAVRRLTTEQRKLTHALAQRGEESSAALEQLGLSLRESVEDLGRGLGKLRSEVKTRARSDRQRIEELRDEFRTLRAAVAAAAPSTPGRRKGERARVGVFIDVQNVYYGARQLKGKLDFDALLQAAVRDRRLIHAAAYVVETKEIDQSGFIARLQQRAITVRRKTLKVRADRSMKGDWDMEMALDILDAAANLDVVVLVSGDGDFTSLVKRVKSIGPRVEVVGFPRNTAKSLLESADRYQPLGREFMIRGESQGEASDDKLKAGGGKRTERRKTG